MDRKELVRLRKEYIAQQFSHLNDRQQMAVFHTEGAVLVLAGAGSGKTSVIINRISNLVRFGNSYTSPYFPPNVPEEYFEDLERAVREETTLPIGEEMALSSHPVRPYNILAITFTNKAAGELRDRLSRTLGELAEEIQASTFHSLCVRLLRRFGGNIGFDSNFTIYDTDDSKRVMKEIYSDFKLDRDFISIKTVLNKISGFKDKMIGPREAADSARNTMDRIVAKCYAEYQDRLRKAKAMDFDDLIFHTVRLLSENDEAYDYCFRRFRYVMVDEYQDTSVAQFQLVRLLSGQGNICVVGDDDQSIYRFRGATIENILNFEEHFRGAEVIRLEQNYRSTANILDAANSVIKNNRGRKGKTLWTDAPSGDRIKVFILDNESREAANVVSVILDNLRDGARLSDHAVLYRMNMQSSQVENRLARNGVPYTVVGGHRFYDRAEIKDILAYINIVVNPDDDLRLKRIINTPSRKIGTTTVNTLEAIARRKQISLLEVIYNLSRYPELSRRRGALSGFLAVYQRISEAYRTLKPDEFVRKLIEITGYEKMLRDQGREGEERLENIGQLVSNVTAYMGSNPEATMDMFLEEVSLISDIDVYDENRDKVTLMTVHSAKGLEFPYVFLIGMEEGIFPGEGSRYEPRSLEEERRLCYVGITRAKKALYVSLVRQRLVFGRTSRPEPSRFVEEIDEDLCEEIDRSTKPIEYLKYDYVRTRPERPPLYNKGKSALTAKKTRTATAPKGSFRPGDRVKHRAFGEGTVEKATRVGNDMLLEVRFDKAGLKKIMANYAPISKI